MSIEDNWNALQTKVEEVCKKVGRRPDEITIVGVSKLQSMAKIQDACAAGLKNFGENYVQEFSEKKQELAGLDLVWHLIGPLQSNKVKWVAGQVEMIHSVDRISLAETLSKNMISLGKTQKILVQVNLSKEESKSGVPAAELKDLVGKISQLAGLKVLGFMTMPPLVNSAEQNRIYFKELKSILEKANQEKWTGEQKLQVLSMGTSQDYAVAIEEGATHIRVGTTIFGEREK